MSETVKAAIIAASIPAAVALLLGIVTAILAHRARKQSELNAMQIREVHIAMNSRMDELLEEARRTARLEERELLRVAAELKESTAAIAAKLAGNK